MRPPDPRRLRERLGQPASRTLSDATREVALAAIAEGTCLDGRVGDFAGRRVLLSTQTQFSAALALIDLDGVAEAILLCPPDLSAEHRAGVAREAGIDAVVCDDPAIGLDLGLPLTVTVASPAPLASPRPQPRETDWLLLTSGTTGQPKIVAHRLAALTGAIQGTDTPPASRPVWATFYDIRRYGGLQIYLRAMSGGASLVLSEPGEAIAEHLARLAARGVTHISGTPSHWRKALMCSAVSAFSPAYVRLSGEIADQPVLDALALAFPGASVGHAYASTEAGVGFAVDDGLEGFPARLVDEGAGEVEMKVVDGCLMIRSPRTGHAYLGSDPAPLMDADGFVDTGDFVERRGDRFHFVGRRGGIINVGGLKVHPEEVEAVINQVAGVGMSRVRARKSPITGAIVVADVTLANGADAEAVKAAIATTCRERLAVHKRPALVSVVAALDMTPAGKLKRAHG